MSDVEAKSKPETIATDREVAWSLLRQGLIRRTEKTVEALAESRVPQ